MRALWCCLIVVGCMGGKLLAQEEAFSDPIRKESKHSIIYLVATPCSGLVETLRMMHERRDMYVMHIPANLAYCYKHNYLHLVEGWYRQNAPTSYSQAAAEIECIAKEETVCVGENTHTAVEFLADNPDFANRQDVQYVFLIGDPHHIIISYYDKKKGYFDELPEEQMAKSVGFKELYAFILSLKEKEKRFFVCRTRDLYQHPEITVQALSAYLDIPYVERALHWQDLSSHFQAFPFWTIENRNCSLQWHSDAIASTGFTSLPAYAVNEQGDPTFEEIINEKHRRICQKAYDENKMYYDLITALE